MIGQEFWTLLDGLIWKGEWSGSEQQMELLKQGNIYLDRNQARHTWNMMRFLAEINIRPS